MREKSLESKLEYKKAILLIVGVTLLILVVFIGMVVVFFYAAKPLEGAEPQKLPGFKTYHSNSKKSGVVFDYPDILKVQEKNEIIAIEHSVSFEHYDPCDQKEKGGIGKSKKMRDFYMTIQMVNKSADQILGEYVAKTEGGAGISFKEKGLVAFGNLVGLRLWLGNGSHGCGHYSYFFQLGDEKVLRVDRWPAPEFREVPEEEKQMYSRLRLIILPEREEHIFRNILDSLKWGAK